tara:strand:+ start:725 stop:946 length:222 start_codon:yes stop_codon:yes gene_type:complete
MPLSGTATASHRQCGYSNQSRAHTRFRNRGRSDLDIIKQGHSGRSTSNRISRKNATKKHGVLIGQCAPKTREV